MKNILVLIALLASGNANAKPRLGNAHYHSVISGYYRHQDPRCKLIIHLRGSSMQTNHCKFWLKK